jgi:alkylation response protein AidB-like acyl-CoA dehydrogenase
MNYQPQASEAIFFMETVLNASERLAELPLFQEVDAALMMQILEEAGKFISDEIAPLNQTGDSEGAKFSQGQVTMPPGFAAAYQAFWRAGWASLTADTEDGGQGLPALLDGVLYEWLSAANHGWTMAPGLLHGAYECIKHHASDELKTAYLSKIGSGEWLATMCLTEPHAGSDLGRVHTKAHPTTDAQFRINGTKIFISGGEHDLTDNIVHLVLARLPDAPPGPKGLSLFLLPKFYNDGTRSAVYCERIEEKMGIHASPTCVMRFDDALGWMVGEANKGLNAMFIMMNAARLHVALQGVGLLDAAWQKANAYAHERRQMRAPKAHGTLNSNNQDHQGPDLIIAHPAIRRVLDTQRAWIDTSRVLAYETSLALDIAKHHPDAKQREAANRWCALVTPVLKSACTDQGFHGASECLQVFGGHGYVREWGIEQHVRDARIAMIYEGTNEIQALDLLMRKVLGDGGANLFQLCDQLILDIDGTEADGAHAITQLNQLRAITAQAIAVSEQPTGVTTLSAIAGDYLRLTHLTLMGWAWRRIRAATEADDPRWTEQDRALKSWVLPEFNMRLTIIQTQFAAP